MFCKHCGKPMEEGSVFCGNCGRAQAKTSPVGAGQGRAEPTPVVTGPVRTGPVAMGQPAPKKGSKVVIITVIVALLVVMAAGGGFLFWQAKAGEITISFLPWLSKDDAQEEEADDDADGGETDAGSAGGTLQPDAEAPATATNTLSYSEINNIISSNIPGAQVGIYVKNLSTGYTYGFNERITMPSSAMSYIPIMLSVTEYAANNNINIDSDGMVFNYVVNGMEKPNSKNDDGMYFTIRNYFETVAKYGDNNRANELVDWIGNGYYKAGFSYINSIIQQHGYNGTSINRKIVTREEDVDYTVEPNTTCAYDVANLFDDLLANGYAGDRNYMKRICQYTDNKEMPQGIRKEFSGSIYNIANHFAINTLSQNEVASFSYGNEEVIIAVLVTLQSNENNVYAEARTNAINQLFNYIVQNQFAD